MAKEKTYQVDLYKGHRHGRWGSNYHGIGSWVVTATSKKAAKELVLDNMIGLRAKDWNFPIDATHAPEYHKVYAEDGRFWYEGKASEVDEHIINEYDIQLKDIIIADITEIKNA
jgi:hypothetical protein